MTTDITKIKIEGVSIVEVHTKKGLGVQRINVYRDGELAAQIVRQTTPLGAYAAALLAVMHPSNPNYQLVRRTYLSEMAKAKRIARHIAKARQARR